MDVVYQLIFFFSIAMIAIVATIYVLAVSLLGRAIRLSTQDQTHAEEKRKEDTENEIKKIQTKLDQVKDSGRIDVEDLYKDLKDLDGKIAKHKWKLRWLKIKPKLLTAGWGVLVPGGFFLLAAIFSCLAIYFSDGEATVVLYTWIAVSALAIGICFVCLTLKVIEGVSITSEETTFMREAEALKSSLRAFEEEKRPILDCSFSGEQPPFHMKAESEIVIKIIVEIVSGDVARNPTVFIMAPVGFEFPDNPLSLPPRYAGLTNYVSIMIELTDMLRGVYREVQVKLKAPSQPKEYDIFYSYLCEGFPTRFGGFQVVVE